MLKCYQGRSSPLPCQREKLSSESHLFHTHVYSRSTTLSLTLASPHHLTLQTQVLPQLAYKAPPTIVRVPPPGLTPPLAYSNILKAPARTVGRIIILKPIAPLLGSVTSAGKGSIFTSSALFALWKLTIRKTRAQSIEWCHLTIKPSCSVVATSLRRG